MTYWAEVVIVPDNANIFIKSHSTCILLDILEQPRIATAWFTNQGGVNERSPAADVPHMRVRRCLLTGQANVEPVSLRTWWWRQNMTVIKLTPPVLKWGDGKGQTSGTRSLCVCVNGKRKGKRGDWGFGVCKGFDGRQKKQTHPLPSPPRPVAFPSLRLLRSSCVRKPAPVDGFLENFAATSRPFTEGDGGEFPTFFSSSPTTCLGRGSSAPLPPKKYKSKKSPKHTAITATLPWIRMVRATCYGWERQSGPHSWLRVRQDGPSWHFPTAPYSHFCADDDGAQRSSSPSMEDHTVGAWPPEPYRNIRHINAPGACY